MSENYFKNILSPVHAHGTTMAYNPYTRPGFNMACFDVSNSRVREKMERFKQSQANDARHQSLHAAMTSLRQQCKIELEQHGEHLNRALQVVERQQEMIQQLRQSNQWSRNANNERTEFNQSFKQKQQSNTGDDDVNNNNSSNRDRVIFNRNMTAAAGGGGKTAATTNRMGKVQFQPKQGDGNYDVEEEEEEEKMMMEEEEEEEEEEENKKKTTTNTSTKIRIVVGLSVEKCLLQGQVPATTTIVEMLVEKNNDTTWIL